MAIIDRVKYDVAKVEKGKVVECEYCGSPIKGV